MSGPLVQSGRTLGSYWSEDNCNLDSQRIRSHNARHGRSVPQSSLHEKPRWPRFESEMAHFPFTGERPSVRTVNNHRVGRASSVASRHCYGGFLPPDKCSIAVFSVKARSSARTELLASKGDGSVIKTELVSAFERLTHSISWSNQMVEGSNPSVSVEMWSMVSPNKSEAMPLDSEEDCCEDPDIEYQIYSLSQCMNCMQVFKPPNH